ncbi:PDC sensor domain-containing protein [Thiomicrorhabdus hydrogeniphila]
MQEFITIYQEHKNSIEKFLLGTIRNNAQCMTDQVDIIKGYYGVFNSLELIYVSDEQFNQTSANIFKNKLLTSAIGKNRSYLAAQMINKDEGFSISEPYMSSATGEACITLMVLKDKHYFFFDFNLSSLLSHFGLVERHPTFNFITKAFYLGIGVSLMFFSVMSIGYAFYDYLLQFSNPSQYSLESVFKPIIALTMGLAIFDLAKTLLEREVVYKNYSDKKDEARLLSKFLTAIIIALSIEALMVVFKTALNDPTQMLYALYLIIGVALIILSLAVYTKVNYDKLNKPK